MGQSDLNSVLDGIAIITGATVLAWVVLSVRKVSSFWIDWVGHPADPKRGVLEQKSVMAQIAEHGLDIKDIKKELKPNGGLQWDKATGEIKSGTIGDMQVSQLQMLDQFMRWYREQGYSGNVTTDNDSPEGVGSDPGK